ncbi:MAG: hypothetical protein ACTSRU_20460 [Candidatus Hodarchaeales archaeon]
MSECDASLHTFGLDKVKVGNEVHYRYPNAKLTYCDIRLSDESDTDEKVDCPTCLKVPAMKMEREKKKEIAMLNKEKERKQLEFDCKVDTFKQFLFTFTKTFLTLLWLLGVVFSMWSFIIWEPTFPSERSFFICVRIYAVMSLIIAIRNIET